jgi:hypothetical protein
MDIPPLFIGSAGRSGSTLLVDLLGMHENISPIYETDFVTKLVSLFYSSANELSFNEKKKAYSDFIYKWSEQLPQRPHNKREHEKYKHGPHHILFSKKYMRDLTNGFLNKLTPKNREKSIGEYLNSLFNESANKDNKEFWVNKTPIYVQFPQILKKWFSNMKFIHIVRDGRDVSLSVLTRPWGPDSIKESSDWWMNNVMSGIKFGKNNPNNYIEVKYEDLIVDPEKTINEILDQILIQEDNSEESRNMLDQYHELDKNMIGKWKSSEYVEELKDFTKKTNELLSYFGYLENNLHLKLNNYTLEYPNSNKKTEILEFINSQLEDEIIEKIFLDEVEISLEYFENNELDLNRFEHINFVTKKVDLLIQETLIEADEYLPNLKAAIIKTSQLFRIDEYNKANELFNQAVDGLEWYLNTLNSIVDLKDESQTVSEIEELLNKFNMALNRAMISLNQEKYNDFADLIEVEIIEYLDKLQSYHQELLEE